MSECCGQPSMCEQPCFHGGQALSGVDAILAERQKTHGDFETHAKLAQALKEQMRTGKQWPHLNPMQKEALDMIQHKIARILNGDQNNGMGHWPPSGWRLPSVEYPSRSSQWSG